jgi:hypothetical protein
MKIWKDRTNAMEQNDFREKNTRNRDISRDLKLEAMLHQAVGKVVPFASKTGKPSTGLPTRARNKQQDSAPIVFPHHTNH